MFLASLSTLVIVSELVMVLSLRLLDPVNNVIHSLFHMSTLIAELVLHVTRERKEGLINANSERIILSEVRDNIPSSLLNHHQIMVKSYKSSFLFTQAKIGPHKQ